MRLKRCFGKIDKAGQGEHALTDTIENARDLEWFLTRYSLEGSADDLAYLSNRASQHKERESFIDSLLNRRVEIQPFDLKLPPREYQTVAAMLALTSGGLLNADELGLGKTCSAICTFTDPRTLPAVVVTHVHLLRQWQDELQKFAPNLTTHIIKKTTPYDLTARRRKRNGQLALPSAFPDVTLINWHKKTCRFCGRQPRRDRLDSNIVKCSNPDCVMRNTRITTEEWNRNKVKKSKIK